MTEIDKWIEEPLCPVCEDPDHVQLLVNIHGERPILKWRICEKCGHLFVSPRPTDRWMADYYGKGYREDTHGVEDSSAVPESCGAEEINRSLRLIHYLIRFRGENPIAKHLDVGSSTGALIAGIMDRFEAKYSVGVEPNDAWREFSVNSYNKFIEAQKIDDTTLKTYISLYKVPKSPKFDLVTFSHVLEHMPDPLGAIKRAAEGHLLKSGVLMIETPQLLGGNADPLMFPHIHAFTPETLRNLIERAGLHVHFMETFGSVGPFFMSPQHLTAIAMHEPISYNKTEVLRKFNLYQEHAAQVRGQINTSVPVYKEG